MPWLENVLPEVWPTKGSITSFNVLVQLLLDVGFDDINWLWWFDLLIISNMHWNLAGSPWESMTFAKEGPCRSLICSPICSLLSWYTKRRFLLMPSFFYYSVFARIHFLHDGMFPSSSSQCSNSCFCLTTYLHEHNKISLCQTILLYKVMLQV